MTPALLDKPRRHALRERCAGARGRGLTLEQRLGATLVAAKAGEPADCPICPGTMRLTDGGAVCSDCGSRLS